MCRTARAGVKAWLSTLLGLVVCGGIAAPWLGPESTSTPLRVVRRLNLANLRWEPMPTQMTCTRNQACCAVRGTIVRLGGADESEFSNPTVGQTVEMLSEERGAFMYLPQLSCGIVERAATIAVEETNQ